MVFAVILSHGRYIASQREIPDVNVPYNIRLILYTNPGKDLSADEVDYIFRQLLETKDTINFTFKPEILNIENPPYIPFELKSPPHFTRIKKTIPYPNDKRDKEIGKTYKPLGKFRTYEPGSTTPNIELELKSDFANKKRSVFAEPKIVLQTQNGSDDSRGGRQKHSIGFFLEYLSCFYEKEFPGKIVNVLQLSCRSDAKDTSYSIDELADTFSDMASMKDYEEDSYIDYRPRLEGVNVQNKSENLYKSPDFEFEHKNPPYIIKKSEDVEIPNPSVCSSASGGRKIYKRRTNKKKNVTKKYKNKNTKKYKNKNTKKYKPRNTKNTRKYKY
jgi:hypothetical protein